jgi:CBS domain-containing protein
MTESFKVSQFINRNFKVVGCSSLDPVEKAKTLMLLNDFSQLPVFGDNNKVEGAVSWKSIGKSEAIGKSGGSVIDYMEEPALIKDSSDFLKYIKLVAKKDYVFVINGKNELVGIITTYDMTIYFKDFITPFLKLGVIEDSLRRLIIKNSLLLPNGKDVNDLMFGQYFKVFSDDQNWNKLKFPLIDKTIFLDKLNELRVIRNKVAHYRPDSLTNSDYFVIETFSEIIQKVCT